MVKHIVREFSAIGIGLAFIMVGVDHFIHPDWYEPIVPKVLGNPEFWVYLSGITEIGFGLTIIPKKTREYSAIFGSAMLVALYWANLNMWLNDIPLSGITYGLSFHIVRLVIQIGLILFIAWIAEITPFKNEERGIEGMDIFKGRITSSAFSSGDRIVIGDWMESPMGRFTDIMWADTAGKRILIAPTKEIADYVNSMYTFEETIIEEINIQNFERELQLESPSMKINLKWDRGWPIPFKRSLLFIATVELFFAKLFFGTKTHGVTNNGRKEWYAIDRVSKITTGTAEINNKNLGEITDMTPCKFGFSDAPKKPASCEVRTHIL